MTLPRTETTLTKPSGMTRHNSPEAVAFGDGFYVVYTASTPATGFPFLPVVDTYVQYFDATGKAGQKKMLWNGGGQSPEIVDLGNGKLLAVSAKSVNGDMTPMAAALIDGKTGKVLQTKELGIKRSDHVYEIAFLGNGKAALLATSSNVGSLTDVTQAYILDAKLGVKEGAVLQEYTLNWSQTKDYWQVVDRGGKGATAVWFDRKEFMVYAQLLDNNGKAVGKKLTANTDKLDAPSAFDGIGHSVKTAATEKGDFIVAWSGNATGRSDSYDVWFRIYDASGKAKTKVAVANETTAEAQFKPEVTLLDNGRFALSWVETSTAKLAETHYIRFYDAGGVALSGEVEVRKAPYSLAGTDTEWVRLKDGSLAEIHSDGTAIKAFGVPKPVFGGTKAETFGSAGDDLVMAGGGDDTLNGGAGADILIGGAGADRIGGGAGMDTLTGGKGTDRFVFDAKLNGATNVDRITDFSVADDTIALSGRVFTGIGKAGAFAAGLFQSSGSGVAAEADDRIVYNSTTGELFYDKDGSGAAAAVRFAQLDGKPALSAADFLVL